VTLSPAQVAQINRLDQQAQMCWLVEIEIPLATPSRYRLNNSAHEVEFGTDGEGAPLVYYPFPFSVAPIERDNVGSSFNLAVAASNVTRELMGAVEAYDGLIGQPAKAMLVHKALLGSGEPLLVVEGKIITHRATAKDIAFEIGQEALYRVPIPSIRVDHDFCSHPYGGVLCGYDTTRSGALQTCSFKIEDADGCREHGEDEEAAGLEVRHPLRFGGQVGVPRRQGARA
jgi:phage-related protein